MTHLLQVRIEDDLWQQIQSAAAKDRRSVASWVRLLIEDRLQVNQVSEQLSGVVLPPPGASATFKEGDNLWTWTGKKYVPVEQATASQQKEARCENCGVTMVWEHKKAFGGLCGLCFDERPASVSQPVENSAPTREAAGSTPARRAGKGSPATTGLRKEKAVSSSFPPKNPKSPSRKPKACKHTNQIRKLGRPYCTDCGEFV